MSCLPMIAVPSWLASITDRDRKPGSVDKQHALTRWFLSKIAETYKAVQGIKAEQEMEARMIERMEALERELAEDARRLKEKQQLMRKLEENARALARGRFDPQLQLPFPDVV